MSTFDASGQGAHAVDQHDHLPPNEGGSPYGYNEPGGMNYPPASEAEPPTVSTLDELRSAGEEVDEREPITEVNPRKRIRLTMRTDFEQKDIQRWQFKALPAKHREQLNRRGGQPNLSLLDPIVMYALAIAETTVQVEVRSRTTGEFTVVVDENTGDLLTFADPALRKVIGGIDVVTAVKRAFNRSDPAMLEAGQRLLDAAGFGTDTATDLDGDEDPTSAAG